MEPQLHLRVFAIFLWRDSRESIVDLAIATGGRSAGPRRKGDRSFDDLAVGRIFRRHFNDGPNTILLAADRRPARGDEFILRRRIRRTGAFVQTESHFGVRRQGIEVVSRKTFVENELSLGL